MKKMYKSFNKKVKKMNVWDIKMIKLSTAAFVLMIASLWPQLISLEWYWYGLVFLLAAVIPAKKIFS